MPVAPGAEFNLIIQLVAFVLILGGVRFAIKTHKAYQLGTDEGNEMGQKAEHLHKNLMTMAVVVSGFGAVIWMIPNFGFGWNYATGGFPRYGTGGYLSYFFLGGTLTPHWYLLLAMVVVGTLTAFLGVYLVLRMRWSGFPQRLAVQNFRPVMITTWSLWVLNVAIGILVFYFFGVAGTG